MALFLNPYSRQEVCQFQKTIIVPIRPGKRNGTKLFRREKRVYGVDSAREIEDCRRVVSNKSTYQAMKTHSYITALTHETWRNENPGEGGVSLWATLADGQTVCLGCNGYRLEPVAGGWKSTRTFAPSASVGDVVCVPTWGRPSVVRGIPGRTPGRRARWANRQTTINIGD